MFEMSMVKVNPKLFGTCRLCIEDMGQYVIVPKVQEQIKYCFDINVEPFDGLPQLLCNKCERVLRDYFETKKTFIDKQNELVNKLAVKNAGTENSEKSDVQKRDNSPSETQKPPSISRKQLVLSFSRSNSDRQLQCTAAQDRNDSNKSALWPLAYKKQFACRLCRYCVSKKQNILKHTRTSHASLKMKHQHILKNFCVVKIEKFDKLPNVTGLNDTVVISNEKIFQSVDKNYCVIYTPKALNSIVDRNDKSISSDDECVEKKRQRVSTSSNETLKLENEYQQGSVNIKNATNVHMNGDCINIDDSSDSASEKNCICIQDECNSDNTDCLQNKTPTDKIDDSNTKIQSIVSMCYNKYKKNIDLYGLHKNRPNNPSLSKSQLKHKVLSIGRKIINKQGFNCTGLLRYMEHRNLEILWTQNTTNIITDANYIRIMTKLKGNAVDEDDLGWKTLSGNHRAYPGPKDNPLPKISQVFYNEKHTLCKADSKSKLLNKTPVANPKQMPRKTVVIEKDKELPPAVITQNSSASSTYIPTQNSEQSDSVHSMPDISSVTPLASHQSCLYPQNTNTDHKNECDTLPKQNINDNDTELTGARIKVKPLTELLSQEGLNTLNSSKAESSKLVTPDKQPKLFTCFVQANDIIQANHIVQPGYTVLASSQIVQPTQIIQANQIVQPCQIVQTSHAVQPNQLFQISQVQTNPITNVTPLLSTAPSIQTEYVIMDTVELPNTKTNWPLKYLQNLFQIHNIQLLDAKQPLTSKFVCLIKFKVLYKQQTMEEPILLSISLFCHKNIFCMKVKNIHQEDIDISKISANWQWEIIKVFNGEVVKKLLMNAQKVNQETYEFANTFLRLLKSINYRKL